jgi:hypothetical protein
MPEKKTTQRAQKKLEEGKSPKTAAGEFVHQEIKHAEEGKHDVMNKKQAVAIGLSKARQAGIPVPGPGKGGKKGGAGRSKSKSSAGRGKSTGR